MPSLLSYLFRGAAPALARGQERRYVLGEQQRQEAVRQAEQEREREADMRRLVLQQALGYSQQFQQRDQFEAQQKAAAEQRAVENERNRLLLERQRALDEYNRGQDELRNQRAVEAGERQDVRIGLAEEAGRRAEARANQPPKLRQVPASAVKAVTTNERQLRTIDEAIAAAEANPEAFGFKNYLPQDIVQRAGGKGYRGGVDARAAVADIGSLLIHDRSGAAVTVSEAPRLYPFVPRATDSQEKVLKNLRRLRARLSEETESMRETFTPEYGFTGIGGGESTGPVPQAKPNPSQAKKQQRGYRTTNPFKP